MFQSPPHILLAVILKGVKVHPEGPREQHGFLWDTRRDISDTRQSVSLPVNLSVCLSVLQSVNLSFHVSRVHDCVFLNWHRCLLCLCVLVCVCTCGIIVSLDLRSWSPISEILIPSMVISPPAASSSRNKQRVIEDFPAPVRPTIPICNTHTQINS